MDDNRSLHDALQEHGIYNFKATNPNETGVGRRELWSVVDGFLGYFDARESWTLVHQIERMENMPATAEYGSPLFEANKAVVELRAEKYSSKLRTKVRLIKSSKGYEMAGSCARWTDGYYAVRWNRPDGSIHGGRYLTLAKAIDHFDRVTGFSE